MDTRHRWAFGLAVLGGAFAYSVCVVGLGRLAGWRIELAVGVGLVAALAVEAGAFLWRMGQPPRGGSPVCTGIEALMGQPCSAVTALTPDGSVQMHGELWHARLASGGSVDRGAVLRVIAVDGLCLVVDDETVSEAMLE